MPTTGNLDDEARAELLCYLIASHLAARSSAGQWLRTDQCIEFAHIWLKANGGDCDSHVPTAFGEISADIAARVYALGLVTNDELVTLFTDSCRLDYRRRATQDLHDICADWLCYVPSKT